MPGAESVVTVHMATSLDGFIARRDGRVDWMDTPDVALRYRLRTQPAAP